MTIPVSSEPQHEKTAIKKALLNPLAISILLILIAAIGLGISSMVSAAGESEAASKSRMSGPVPNPYSGVAKVISFDDSSGKCMVKLQQEGGTIQDHEMTPDTCEHILEGEVVEVVQGIGLPEVLHIDAEEDSHEGHDH